MSRGNDLVRSASRVGVMVVDEWRWVLRCETCHYGWQPMLPLRRGWRECPNGCNANRLSNGKTEAYAESSRET